MEELLGLSGLTQSVRRIRESADTFGAVITQGQGLLEDAAVQMERAKAALDQNEQLLKRAPRTFALIEATCVCVCMCACAALIKYMTL